MRGVSKVSDHHLNIEAIKEYLPHREPMLLVEEARLVDGVATGRYTVRGDEFFLAGHFPGNPMVPGVILCEMMAQSSCLLLEPQDVGRGTYLAGMNKVKFKCKVVPGDTIEFKCELIAKRGPFYFVKGSGYVRDRLCVSGEISIAAIREADDEQIA
jgi:3-hydroxyacyl-[acyl-carrier-protein] dehydratase